MENFRKLGLSEEILKAIKDLKFSIPTAIQEKAIPLVLQGKDVIGNAATGSGKTLAFAAGIIEKVKKHEGIQALILTPTRELADQITESLRTFARHHGLTMQDVYGGVGMENQIKGILKSEVIIGTPGRILDHLTRGTLNLSKVQILVLDEADRMVDMGFMPDVEKIIKACSTKRQTLLFSATTSQDIEYVARNYMHHPVYVKVESYVDPTKLRQYYYDVDEKMKFSLLYHLLKEDRSGLIMVFSNTRQNADLITQNLKNFGLKVASIHGGLKQNKRNAILKKFQDENIRILVCTDVAARGLDIDNVSHIYNYDSPKTSTEYIHRIGRTARAGKEGEAISLISNRDYLNFQEVCSDKSLKISRKETPRIQRVQFQFILKKRFERMHSGNSRFQHRRSSFRSYNL